MPFDLDNAIAAWRRALRYRRAFLTEDLDELEAHLRDHVERLVARGVSEQEAFSAAVQRLGDAASVEDEYRKVFWLKLKHKRALLRELIWELTMLRNYVTVALRNLRRHTGYTFINVSGLALGMACALLIALFVRDELSYDRYHDNAERVYRVTRAWYDEGGTPTLQLARISAPIGPALEEEIPEVEEAVRIMQWSSVVSYDDQHFEEDRFFFAEDDLFDLFTIPFIQGDPETALAEPYSVVVTEAMAEKYFGDENPIGHVLRFDGEYDLQVTGVVENAPPNTHFHYDFLASFATLEAQPWSEDLFANWGGFNNFMTYILLPDGKDVADLEAKLPAFLDRHYTPHVGVESRLQLQPLTDIHLHSHLDSEFEPNGNIAYVYLLGAIAFFVLLIACFNFMNLATARSARRAKEVGLRKVLGGERGQLIRQFLGESILMAFIAAVLAVGLAAGVLPLFNDLSGKTLALFGMHGWFVAASLVGIALFVGLVAGSYPALFLSRFQPAVVLKGATGGSWRSRFRTVLVVTQFAISIVLIAGVAVIARQLDYVQNKRLGFDQERLVVLPMTSNMQNDFEAVRSRLLEHPGVRAVTASQLVPSQQLVNTIAASAEVNGAMRRFESLPLLPVDHDFAETYGMEVVAGRTFSKERASDSTKAFVLNEAAVQHVGWPSPEEAVGKPFVFHFGSGETRRGQVIGVVRDFHFESLHERIAPLVLFVMPERYNQVTVRLAGQDLAGSLAFLEKQWATYRPDRDFTYTFVDESFGALYQAEERLGQIFGAFAILALLIACLGLFGLASYIAEQRTKEIGVRKVLGATVSSIVVLLAKDFGRLVLIAFVIASPLAYIGMSRWLDRFAYHIDISWPIFLMAGLTALGVALLTVGYQSVKAAVADPVKSLRYE